MGNELGKYRLERLLGKGGMGEVWAAYDPDLDRRIALKVLHPHIAAVEDARMRFQREGRAMARLRHPNVITVHDATFSEGRGLIAMELVDGESLATWMTRDHATDEIVRVIVAAGRGLAAAHAAGMIHRDFKPHNVLVDHDQRVLVTDFGLARTSDIAPPLEREPAAPSTAVADAAAPSDPFAATATPDIETVASGTVRAMDPSSPLTAAGALVGTPAYMSPEQLAGDPAESRSDVFAFCLTAWELFAKERPFRGKTLAELHGAIARGEQHGGEKVPRRLRPVLARGLSHEPDKRWPTMSALLDALERAWRRPRRIAIAGAAGVVAVAAAVAIVAGVREPTRAAVVPPGCEDSARAVETAWSPAIRRDLEKVIDKPHVPRTIAFFERWGTTWIRRHAETCAQPAEPRAAEQRRCLHGIRDELAATMARRETIPAAMWTAPDFARLVPLPDACMHDPVGTVPPPPPAGVADEVTKIRIELALARIPLVTANPLALAVDVSPQLARARATGYRPLIAEAMIMEALTQGLRAMNVDRKERGPACDAIGKAAVEAEAVRYDRMVVEALLLRYECLADLRTNTDELRQLLARLQTITERNRNPFQMATVALKLSDRNRKDGQYARAFEDAIRACKIFDDLEITTERVRCRRHAAAALEWRNGDGDLERAAKLLEEAYDLKLPFDLITDFALTAITWQRTGDAGVPADHYRLFGERARGELTVRVVEGAAGAGGATVGVAPWLYADSKRVMMGERAPVTHAINGSTMVVGKTQADGTVEIEVPEGSLVFARAGDRSGFAAIPERGDVVEVRIGPSAHVTGATTGIHDAPRTEATDLAGRAARRRPGVVLLVREVGTARFIAMAPIERDGAWKIDGVPPGRYLLAAQTDTGLDGTIAAQTWIDLKPGANPAPALAVPAKPRVVELVARPATDELVVFGSDAKPPKTWAAMQRQLGSASWLAGAEFERAGLAERESEIGDGIARVPVAGPAIACALDGNITSASSPLGWPRAREQVPRCTRIAADASRVIIR